MPLRLTSATDLISPSSFVLQGTPVLVDKVDAEEVQDEAANNKVGKSTEKRWFSINKVSVTKDSKRTVLERRRGIRRTFSRRFGFGGRLSGR
jgi:hypothetical protein